MSKILECSKVNPQSNCDYIARGETEQDVLQDAKLHAQQQHGIQDLTPDLMSKVKENIHDESF
jgi:predicted small metal-binding protein